jgi:energy-converting hydrogenase Eha subunit C
MALDIISDRILFVGAVALLMLGAIAAWTSANVIKRVAAIALANIGAMSALSVLGAPDTALIAAVAAAFAQLTLGVALIVLLQERYSAIEAPDIDAADAQSEPTGRET